MLDFLPVYELGKVIENGMYEEWTSLCNVSWSQRKGRDTHIFHNEHRPPADLRPKVFDFQVQRVVAGQRGHQRIIRESLSSRVAFEVQFLARCVKLWDWCNDETEG